MLDKPLLAISILLCVGISSVLFLPAVGISPIVGFFLAGIAFGDYGLHLIPHTNIIGLLADMGIVFLMFDIGLHFSLKRVWSERKSIFILGPGQIILSGLLFYVSLVHFFNFSVQINVLLAITAALSSTAVAAQALAEKKLTGLPLATQAMAMLIFQDICAIFVLILANSIGSLDGGPAGIILLKAAFKCVASVTIAAFIGKYFLSSLFRFFARFNNSDAFTMIALLVVLATGVATAAFGLSLTLGAFLAGMIISETPFRHIIQTEVKPFRNLLLSFFFVTVGMSINVPALLHSWDTALIIMLGAIFIKITTIFLLFMLMGEGRISAIQQSLLLFQGSEFVFVILAQPNIQAALSPVLKDSIIAGVAVSMALTSLLFTFGRKIARRCVNTRAVPDSADIVKKPDAVLILGMNDVAATVASALETHDVPYIIIERDYQKFALAQENGFPVVYGDRADMRFWDSIGFDRYKTMVIASPDLGVSRVYAGLPKEQQMPVERFVCVRTEEEAEAYKGLNNYAHVFLDRGTPPGIEMAAAVLAHLQHEAHKIAAWMDQNQKYHLERQKIAA